MNRHIKKMLLAAMGAALLSSPTLQAADITMSDSQARALGIETAAVQAASNVAGHAYPAEIRVPPANETVLAAPVDGLIQQVRVAEGETVTQNQPIASLLSPGLVGLQRDYLEELASHRVAAQALERDRALAEEGIIAKRRLDESRGAYNQSDARLSALRQSLSLAGMSDEAIDRLDQTRRIDAVLDLVAPRDGTVMERMVTAGERVDAASALVRISALDTLWLEVRLPTERLADVQPGDRVTVVDEAIQAEVILVGSRIDPDDQTVMVRARVDAVDGRLRPGQFLRVRLEGADQADLLRVPGNAVIRQGKAFFIFVATEGGFDAFPVERLGEADGLLTIRVSDTGDQSQLSAGDQVAVDGVAAIKGAWQGMGGDE
ncbi:efflux RND transporter periplasmic adaptor subunit [Guyparkeria sp. SCN-R1]|uniref:efflux RND transporter periplasmic adaptor subunit n=1 Tax=Guyparkeria sp. SCN-R1 TaxID=2341113 RepID=UPI000F647756|nr:efflux RND transporter periplasmic adaptor subunit [Guyparkeria sp. SCN-R1]RRQ23824.1 efflux RND transporter periplasmic adaptor subunit [Guyparkeria sp. SCN-R1]